jgi:hypothetical protein
LLVGEAINEINVRGLDAADIAVDQPVIDPEISAAAEQIAYDSMLFKNKTDLVNQLGIINERKNIGLYQLVIDSRLLPMAGAGSDALAMKNAGHYGAGKSFPLFMTLKLYPASAYHLVTSGSGKSLYQLDDRMIVAHPDTSVNHTRDIIEQTANTAAGNDEPVDKKTLQTWQHFHDSLFSVEAVVSYAAYDFKLEDGDRALAGTENIISGSAGKGLGGNIRGSREVGVKALSEKTHAGE